MAFKADDDDRPRSIESELASILGVIIGHAKFRNLNAGWMCLADALVVADIVLQNAPQGRNV